MVYPSPSTANADVDAAQLQDVRGEEGHEHRYIEAELRHEDGLLHVVVAQEVVPDGPVEGARGVGADVLGPDLGRKTLHVLEVCPTQLVRTCVLAPERRPRGGRAAAERRKRAGA